MLNKYKAGIVGLGYWGNNLARNIILHPDFELVAVVDSDKDAFNRGPIKLDCDKYLSIEKLPIDLDIVFIATRPGSHFTIAKNLISKTKLIVIAKPACSSLVEAQQLMSEFVSIRNNQSIFVDYTYHYSPIFKEFKRLYLEYFRKNEIVNITSYRTNLGIIQADVSIIADLLSHDLSIFLEILPTNFLRVKCISSSSNKWGKVTGVMANLRWNEGHVLSCNSSWISPKKIRHISVVGDSKALLVEELNTTNKLQFIRFEPIIQELTGLHKASLNQNFILGDSFSPKIDTTESLFLELTELANAIETQTVKGMYTLTHAINVWKVIEALEKSLKFDGKEVEVFFD